MNKIFGAILLVAGATIGAGMLAVPVLTGQGGFFPSVILYVISWLFCLGTAFCLLESVCWKLGKEEVNMGTLMRVTFGYSGQISLSIIYILFFISLLTAYLCEGGSFFSSLLQLACSYKKLNFNILGILIFFILFSPFVLLGAKPVDLLNRFLIIGLVISFLIFCFNGLSKVQFQLLSYYSWKSVGKAFPILFLSFGFHNIIPSLFYYLDKDMKKTRLVITIGTIIPLIFYLIWQILTLGVLPLDVLIDALINGHTVVFALRKMLQCPLFQWAGEFFGFFALTSSFIGVSLGLFDFLLDLFRNNKLFKNYFIISILALGVPLVLAMFYPNIALKCLFYGGGIGSVYVIGIAPVMMLWKGRYYYKYNGPKLLPGGKLMLLLLLLLICIDLVFILY